MSVVNADCLEHLRTVAPDTFTAIVTDPPYGLEFMGKGWDKVLPFPEVWVECLRTLKPGGHALIFGGTRTYHRLACAVEDAGFEIRDCLMWLYGQGFPKSMDVSKAIDKAAGVEPIDLGGSPNGRESKRDREKDGKMEVRGKNAGRLTAPASEEAKLWSGYGTALKPAWEPIILARKPLVGTVARNCQEHGTGALNIDGCRIGSEERSKIVNAGKPDPRGGGFGGKFGSSAQGTTNVGRWPANVVLDEEAGAMLDEQSGASKPKPARRGKKGGNSGALGRFAGSTPDAEGVWPADPGGGASRFFYCAKASKRDRGEGNNHPTVKPVELMRWLVRLVKGPGENLILDPFAGSGSTGVAAQLEGVPFVLIEREAEYAEIAKARLRADTLFG